MTENQTDEREQECAVLRHVLEYVVKNIGKRPESRIRRVCEMALAGMDCRTNYREDGIEKLRKAAEKARESEEYRREMEELERLEREKEISTP